MNSQTLILDVMRQQGQADAMDLRGRANGMDGTAIIAEESKVPAFDGAKDYSAWPVGAPVSYDNQVYKLITPYNAAGYPDTNPAVLPALWSITHTKDPAKAKAWAAPNGTSGLYTVDECCTESGHVWRNTYEGNEFAPSAMPERWTDLGTAQQVQA